jgi:hypothetical protein
MLIGLAEHSNATEPPSKVLEYIDKIYEKNIKTAILFDGSMPIGNSPGPAAIPIIQQRPLVLKFDEINTDNADYYKARIIHCNFDWSRSNLTEQQYLYEYNEFSIETYEFSVATKVHYTHFTFPLPRVRLPGNYLLVVYRDSDTDDIILSKRFMVFDQRVKIQGEPMSSGMAGRRTNQQITFTIDYKAVPVSNPYLDILVAVRQNQRWDNYIMGLAPTMVRDDLRQMEFRHLNFDNSFIAGNEFRFFDLRSIHYGGRNVDRIEVGKTQIDAFLYLDKSRGTEPYTITRDLNGGYFIENTESGNDLAEADYINTFFFLDLKGKINDDIYIAGKLTDWAFNVSTRMKYMETTGLYMGNLLLKQGLYDFIYYLPETRESPYLLEGSHFETINEYEILVYFHDPLLNTDLLIGYVQLL